MMRKVFCVWSLMAAVSSAADRPIILVTPAGVWQSDVVNNVPGPFRKLSVNVIVQGFTQSPNPGPGPDPYPSPVDPIVAQVAAISKTQLTSLAEATACAALVDSLSKAGLSGDALKEAMIQAAGILDVGLRSDGRATAWTAKALAVTLDPAKLIQGLTVAWNVKLQSLEMIESLLPSVDGQTVEQTRAEVLAKMQASPGAVVIEEEAFDIASILQIIQMILNLLKSIGVLK